MTDTDYYMRIDRGDGTYAEWGMYDIRNIEIALACDPSGASLPISTLRFRVSTLTDAWDFRQSDEITLTTNVGLQQIYKFYVSSAKRIGDHLYEVEAVDFVGILDKQRFEGGAYTDGASARSIIESIVGAENVAKFSGLPSSSEMVCGVLLPQSARDALAQVLFAIGYYLQYAGDAAGVCEHVNVYKRFDLQDLHTYAKIFESEDFGVTQDTGRQPLLVRVTKRNPVTKALTSTTLYTQTTDYGTHKITFSTRGYTLDGYYFWSDAGNAEVICEAVAPGWGSITPPSVTTVTKEKTYRGALAEIDTEVNRIVAVGHVYAKKDDGDIEVAGNHYQDFTFSQSMSKASITGEAKSKSVETATLVGPFNTDAVALRMQDYYCGGQTYKGTGSYGGKIVLDGLRSASYNFPEGRWKLQAEGEAPGMAYITTAVIRLSAITAAEIEAKYANA